MAAAGDEPGVDEPGRDFVRLVAVEIEELDALVAHARHLAQRRLEGAGALRTVQSIQAETGSAVEVTFS